MKAHEFDSLVTKFGMETRQGRDLHAWLVVDGTVAVRTRRSNCAGDLPAQHSIRQQLHLNEEQLRDAILCSLGLSDYIAILRAKGVLPSTPSQDS
jgi:hypothetical protein